MKNFIKRITDRILRKPLLVKPVVTNRCSNFQQVLVNGDDQVLVRELLKEHVPIEIQIKITQLFNQEFARRQVLRNGW